MPAYVYMVEAKGYKPTIFMSRSMAFKALYTTPGRVYRLSYGYYKDCNFVMDCPTFRVVGELIHEQGEPVPTLEQELLAMLERLAGSIGDFDNLNRFAGNFSEPWPGLAEARALIAKAKEQK